MITDLTRSTAPLVADVEDDDLTREVITPFDLDPAAPKEFFPFTVPANMPTDFGIGLIVGASGSGKSQLLKHFGDAESLPEWLPKRSLASHFASAAEATDRFYAVGLNTVPVWRLPYNVLSNGQKFRADLARTIGNDAVVDEFTSVVDRNVAISASRALSAWVQRTNTRRLVLASCHRDVIDWLRPDWVIDTDAGTFTVGEVAARPSWYGEFIKPEGVVGRIVLR